MLKSKGCLQAPINHSLHSGRAVSEKTKSQPAFRAGCKRKNKITACISAFSPNDAGKGELKPVKIFAYLIAAVIPALHIGSAALSKKLAEILIYVNLTLHIAEFFLLMALEVSFEFCALFFMISLFSYLFLSFLSYKIRERRKK